MIAGGLREKMNEFVRGHESAFIVVLTRNIVADEGDDLLAKNLRELVGKAARIGIFVLELMAQFIAK